MRDFNLGQTNDRDFNSYHIRLRGVGGDLRGNNILFSS